jgi:hypothetical protein
MNCRKARECIQRELDGGLPRHLRTQLANHLNECNECERIRRQFAAMFSAFAELTSATCTPDSGVLKIEHSRRPWWPLPASIAAAIALLFAAWPLLRDPSPAAPRIVQTAPSQPRDPSAAAAREVKTASIPSDSSTPRVIVKLSPDSNMLAVPVPTQNARITILRLYPKIQLARSSDAAGERGS